MLPDEVYQAAQTRELDRIVMQHHAVSGGELMRRAGRAAFDAMMTRFGGAANLVVVCGVGNNGGDGYVVASCAQQIGVPTRALAIGAPRGVDARACAEAYQTAGGVIVRDRAAQHKAIDEAELIVDALFGTGLRRAPEGDAAALIDCINRADCPVLALDLPSGLCADTGVAFAPCVQADVTVTFIGVKLGLLTASGRDVAGDLLFADLNIPHAAREVVAPCARILRAPRLRKRAPSMHKGDAGRVLVVGGDVGMLGATLLSGRAALRGGAGLVTIATCAAHCAQIALHRAELMSVDALADAPPTDVIALGPGLGQSAWSARVFAQFVDGDVDTKAGMVVDADGLNHLARTGRRRDDWLLTPHPGEAARLLDATVGEVQADRLTAAHAIAARYGGVCVLKGAGTLISDGTSAQVCILGNPGMASAGMGDVLTGLLAAQLAQGDAPLAAAESAVWLHARAADVAVQTRGERGLLAGDVIDALPTVLRECQGEV